MGRRKKSETRKKFNLVFGTIIFILLIGSAFAIDLIFGAGFIIGFVLSIYNKVLEKKPFIPIFLFVGALIIRYSLIFIPDILEANTFIDLGISLVLFLIVLVVGWRIRKGKLKVWKK